MMPMLLYSILEKSEKICRNSKFAVFYLKICLKKKTSGSLALSNEAILDFLLSCITLPFKPNETGRKTGLIIISGA